MKRIVKAVLLCSSFFLASVAPSWAEEAAKPPAPAAAPAGAQPQSSDEAGGCAADGKCCGSAACTDAKNKAIKDGKGAAADCPCKHKNKPQHGN